MFTNVNTDKNLSTNGKFYLYVQKSTESEDRRTESIQNQIDYWIKRGEDEWLQIIKVYEDEKSTIIPNRRPGFKKMCEDIESEGPVWILCFELSRLSRNPIDTGNIQYMLQRWKIDAIITRDGAYKSEDLRYFNTEMGIINQYMCDYTMNTKRWMLSKVEKWWFPWVAPRGYANDKISRTIAPDIHEFRIVKRFWEMVLSWESPGNAAKLITQAIDVLGLGDTARGISSANAYQIVRNPFYAGKILYKNEIFPGKHEPMVTWEDFQGVQKTLKKKIDR